MICFRALLKCEVAAAKAGGLEEKKTVNGEMIAKSAHRLL